MPNISKTSFNLEHSARRFISDLNMGDALAPVIILEAAVTGGRTYQAYKRGGFVEARERGTEETLGAIFWLGGVSAFNKIGDKVGEKLLGIKDIGFEVGKDAVRNPLSNYILKHPKYNTKALAAFKFTKIITSILLSNAIIGFVVPKLNQAITRKYQTALESYDKKVKNQPESMDNFEKTEKAENTETKSTDKNSTNNDTKQTAKTNTSFKGNSVQILLSLTNNFENDARYKLLSTDAGVAGGRAINARNQDERREILFRDISSIYFYMFCRKHINNILNYIEDGKTARLNPLTAKALDKHLQANFKQDSYTKEEFENLVLGNKDAKIPEKVMAKAKNGIFELDTLKRILDARTFKSAEAMSKLQPELAGKAILTTEQLKDVFSGGLINKPEFLSEVYSTYTKGKSINPLQFVREEDLRVLKSEMQEYVEKILESAKKDSQSITINTLKKANRNNFIKNAFNLTAGFVICAYFLSTVIPKVQYWMTKKTTGKDAFPGIENCEDKI